MLIRCARSQYRKTTLHLTPYILKRGSCLTIIGREGIKPTQIGLGTSGTDSSILKLDYEYTSSCQTGNNGNVLKQTITAPGLSLIQNYCYDVLNRLSSASENSGANWSQTYGFDRFGNRWVSASSGYALSPLTPTGSGAFNTANNRLFASGYDNAGNQTGDALSRSFTYNAENRQLTLNAAGGQYFYDGDGHRVKKVIGSITTIFVYTAMGQLTAEYTNDTTPPVGGGGTSYLTSDHLGSTRVVTKSDGSVKARYDYLPFGEELGAGIGQRTTGMGYNAADSTRQKFTQKERDSESGLDYFGARYYSSAQGRFASSDPLLSSAEPEDPQAWNRYSYTLNNPLKYVDPLGLYVFDSSVTEEQRKQFRAGFDKAKEQLKQFKEGSEEYKKIKRALDVYGEEGVKNGVSIYAGNVPGDAVGGTRVAGVAGGKTGENPTGQDIRITFEAGQYSGAALAVSVAHEGSHAADGSEWVASGFANSKNPTTYQTEFKAYTVSALVGQKLFPTGSYSLYSLLKLIPSSPNLKMPFYDYLWNSSWAEADVATLRSQNINHHLGMPKKQGGIYGVTESRQGGSGLATSGQECAAPRLSMEVFGGNDVTGATGPPKLANGDSFDNALKNSEVVLYVGHGYGPTESTPFMPLAIEVGFDVYDSGGKQLGSGGNAPKPDSNASVICNFSCNSVTRSDYFNNTGKGFQATVTVSSGRDGYTALGTLEKAAGAFVKAYTDAKGSTQERMAAGIKAAQKVLDASKVKIDGGDTIKLYELRTRP